MKNWRPLPSMGGILGIILITFAAIAFALAVGLTWQAANAVEVVQAVTGEENPDVVPELLTVPAGANLGTFGLALLSFGLLVLVLVLAYHTFRYFKLQYGLDRNAVTIEMGDRTQVIPLANIRQMVLASSVMNQQRNRVYGPGDPSSGGTGATNKAYPRTKMGETATEAENLETATKTLDETEVAEFTAGAADASYEKFAKVEVIAPETASASTNDEATDAETVRFVELDEKPKSNGNGSTSPELEKAVAGAASTMQSGGSVNFSVQRKLFTWWKGFYLNRARVNTLGNVQFYATQPLEKTVLIRTDKQIYAISPQNAEQFVTEFKLRRRLGAIEPVDEVVLPGQFLSHPLWTDKIGRSLILAAVLANVLMFVVLLATWTALPPILKIHFNKFGDVDRIGERAELMALPFLGLLALVGNTVLGALLHPKERIPAYVLYFAAILLQLLTAIAILVILIVSR
jgi:hypothetical protein